MADTDANADAPRFPYKSRGAVAYVGDDVYYLAVAKGIVWVAA